MISYTRSCVRYGVSWIRARLGRAFGEVYKRSRLRYRLISIMMVIKGRKMYTLLSEYTEDLLYADESGDSISLISVTSCKYRLRYGINYSSNLTEPNVELVGLELIKNLPAVCQVVMVYNQPKRVSPWAWSYMVKEFTTRVWKNFDAVHEAGSDSHRVHIE